MFYGAGGAAEASTRWPCRAGDDPRPCESGTVPRALAWLIEQKEPRGTWYSTQATVLALQAILAGSEQPLAKRERRFDISLDGKPIKTLTIPADEGEVTKQIDLSAECWWWKPSHNLVVTGASGTGAGYQATLIYNVPGGMPKGEFRRSRWRFGSTTTKPRSRCMSSCKRQPA